MLRIQRFREVGIVGPIAARHDAMADELEALSDRVAQQHRTLVVLTVGLCTFGLVTLIRWACAVPW